MADNNNTAQTVANAGKQTAASAKLAKKTGKAAAKLGGKLISVVGWKVVAVALGILLIFAVLTHAVPSTSFNAFTHVNKNQLTEEEKNQDASEMKDLTAAEDAEKRGVNVIAKVFKEQKAAAYEKVEELCNKYNVDYETTLQYMESNFIEIGEDAFENTSNGYYSEEEYDAVTILSAYSISVDNLASEKNIGTASGNIKFWEVDMYDKLTKHLSSTDLYDVSVDFDENGKAVIYTAVVDGDKTDELSDSVDDYKDNIEEDVIDDGTDNDGTEVPGIDKDLETEYEEFVDSEAFEKSDALDVDDSEKKDLDLTKEKFIQTTVVKENVEQLAIDAFEVDEEQIKDLYGNTDCTIQEIIRNMSFNSLALLHNITDPEESYISNEELEAAASYTIGDELGEYKIKYYCGCSDESCVANRKGQISSLTGKLSNDRNRVAGVSCAASDLPIGTIIYIEGYGLLVVDDTLKSRYENVISIYLGDEHDKDVLSEVKELQGKKYTASLVTGITEKKVKNMGHSTGELIYPLGTYTTRISSAFGYRIHPTEHVLQFHKGIDLPAPPDTPITAADGGVVISASYNGSYGNMILIQHNNGIQTRYAHCKSLYVKKGEKVSQGQVIGGVGTTGRSTGEHLHFEVIIDGQNVDPVKYIPHDHITNPNYKNSY